MSAKQGAIVIGDNTQGWPNSSGTRACQQLPEAANEVNEALNEALSFQRRVCEYCQ